MIVTTTRLYRRVQAGLRSQDESVRAAAESCLSFLAFRLREAAVQLPAALVPLYESLPGQ